MAEFNRKLNKDQMETYETICELTWGCRPFDVNWAIQTSIYKNMESKLLSSGVIKNSSIINVL